MVESPIVKYRQLFDGTLLEKRSTYANDVDQLAAIQLSFITVQKQASQQKALPVKDLFQLKKKIDSKKLAVSNSVDNPPSTPFTSEVLDTNSFEDIFTSYVSFLKHCNIIDKADVDVFVDSKNDIKKDEEDNLIDQIDKSTCLGEKNLSSPLPKKNSLSSPQLGQKTPKNLRTATLQTPHNSHTALTPFAQSPKSSSNVQLRSIIISYFQLIVNSRNEIALARIIDEPTRGIDHKSFTDIRKFALDKGMPMYQVISSFIRQVVLGGKGYAPNDNHALYEHKEGLMEFMELMDKLQTIVDEGDSIASVLTSLLKALKVAFVRAKHPVFSNKTVSIVIQELSNVIKSQFLKIVKEKTLDMCFSLRDFVDFMSSIAGNEISPSSSQLCGILTTPDLSSTTFKKITTLVTKFNTPGIVEETPKKSKDIPKGYDNDDNDDDDIGKFDGIEVIDKSTPILPQPKENDEENELKNNEENDKGNDLENDPENNTGNSNLCTTPLSKPVKLIRCQVAVGDKQNKKGKIAAMLTKEKVKEKVKEKEIEKEKDDTVSNIADKVKEKPVVVKKDQKMVKKRVNAPTEKKAKCAKKIKLLSGQKTLSQFFSK